MNKRYEITTVSFENGIYRLTDTYEERVIMQGSLTHIHAYISLLQMGFTLN